MSTVFYSQNHNWQALYRAAILEPDSGKVPGRIAEAQKEIVQRARALFQETGNNIQEEQALDSAMCSLHVFRSTLRKAAGSIPASESPSLCG